MVLVPQVCKYNFVSLKTQMCWVFSVMASSQSIINIDHTDIQENVDSDFGVSELLENLLALGMNTVNKWDVVMCALKTNAEIASSSVLLNMYFVIRVLFTALSNHMLSIPESQDKIFILNEDELGFDEVFDILAKTLNKKSVKDKRFSSKSVSKLCNIIRGILEKKLALVLSLVNVRELRRNVGHR